jgi:hypothetical protein
MANQYIHAPAAPGRAVTAKLWNLPLTLEYASVAAVEIIPNAGIYLVDIAGGLPLAGEYRLIMQDDLTGYGIATYQVVFEGIDGEQVEAAEFVNVDISGGDATAANQTAILAAITPITTVYNAQPSSETINLVRGDAYDGVANAKLSWTASKSVDAQTVNFTIRDSKDVIILDQDTTGVTTSAAGTLVEVSLSTSATELLDPDVSVFKFDVEIEFSADSRWTITKGNVCVERDESR